MSLLNDPSWHGHLNIVRAQTHADILYHTVAKCYLEAAMNCRAGPMGPYGGRLRGYEDKYIVKTDESKSPMSVTGWSSLQQGIKICNVMLKGDGGHLDTSALTRTQIKHVSVFCDSQ